MTLTVTDSNGLQSATSRQIAISGPVATAKLGTVKISGNTAAVTLTCAGAATCTVGVQLSVKETLRRGSVIAVTASAKAGKTTKTVVVGKVTATLSGGQTRTIQIKLNRAGRQLLAKFGKVKVTLALTSAGKTVAHRTVTFTEKKTKAKK